MKIGEIEKKENEKKDDRGKKEGRKVDLNGKRRVEKRLKVNRRVNVEFSIDLKKNVII